MRVARVARLTDVPRGCEVGPECRKLVAIFLFAESVLGDLGGVRWLSGLSTKPTPGTCALVCCGLNFQCAWDFTAISQNMYLVNEPPNFGQKLTMRERTSEIAFGWARISWTRLS